MAYFNQNNSNVTKGMNEKEDEQQQLAGPTGVQLTSGGVNNTTAPSAPTPQAPKAASSGMAPSFGAYTKANQGAATNKLANAAQSNVQNLGNQAQTSITQATNKFGQKVDAGTLKNRYQAVQDVANTVNTARNISAPAQAQPSIKQDLQNNNTVKSGQVATNTGIVPPVVQQPQAPTAIDQSQIDRFKEVINAKYQGPESLRQSGLYNPAQKNVAQASQAVQNSSTAQGREELLRQMYEKRGDYTRGLNKLDTSLLNSSKSGVQNLQNTADNFKNVANDLTKAQINSTNLAQNRTQEIKDIQEQARNTFTQGKQAEEAATEERLAAVVKDWDKLPEHFRDIIRNKATANQAIQKENTAKLQADPAYQKALAAKKAAEAMKPQGTSIGHLIASNLDKKRAIQAADKTISDMQNASKVNMNSINLSPEEAAILGIQSGEGLYNLGADAIKTAAYDKEKLISRDEQARQSALAALAGLDQSNRLDTTLKYGNAQKAGTQSAIDALDLAGTRAGLNEAEKDFRKTAEETNLIGRGLKKVSRGNAWGKKTKTYTASVGGNAGDFLEKAGYDLDSENMNQGNIANQKEALLRAALSSSTTNRNNADLEDSQKILGGAGQGAAAGASIGSVIPGVGTAIGAAIGSSIGMMAGGGSVDNLQNSSDLINGYAPGVGKAIQDTRAFLGNNVKNATSFLGSDISKGLGGAVGGIDASAMKAYGSAIAKDRAIKDLNKKYTGFLDSQGFENRFTVGNNDVTSTRMTALQQLLANLDKTNKG
jgi:hypothetical protein